ncbi:DUF4270 domain-containing protein [Bacteroidales bacterium OttesenSCG-928-I14]|nr:DUF4270 domain-containing protein [Bacteroidales bacterium OttesenSCG-928-I14]
MKTKLFLLTFVLCFVYFACDDSDLSDIGMGIQPDKDRVSVFDTIFQIEGKTVKLDSIYAKSSHGYLGNFYDQDYGTIKAGYASQYYPSLVYAPVDSIPEDRRGNEVDSVFLYVYYYRYLGDSITPMETTVYPIVKELEKNYYTTVNPADFSDMNSPLSRFSYTARNLNISDSLNNANNKNGVMKAISIPLPKELGQKLCDNYREYISSESTVDYDLIFKDFFKGLYLESSYGVGNILDVDLSEIAVYYTRYVSVTDTLNVTTKVRKSSYAAYTSTKEVIQLNSFEATNDDKLLAPSDDKMYLKTPAGVFSQITIPLQEIKESIGNRKFSAVKLSIGVNEKSDWKYALDYPGNGAIPNSKANAKLLLIEPDSVKSFFESIEADKGVADSHTSYTSTYSSSSQTYEFPNIANIVQNAIDKKVEGNLELLLIPVHVEYSETSSYYSSYQQDYKTYHYLYPSGATLKKGGENLQIKVIASGLEVNLKK